MREGWERCSASSAFCHVSIVPAIPFYPRLAHVHLAKQMSCIQGRLETAHFFLWSWGDAERRYHIPTPSSFCSATSSVLPETSSDKHNCPHLGAFLGFWMPWAWPVGTNIAKWIKPWPQEWIFILLPTVCQELANGLHINFLFKLTMSPRRRYSPNFTDEKIKAQRNVITCLRSHSLGPGLIPSSAISLACPTPGSGILSSLPIWPHLLDDAIGFYGHRLTFESLCAWLLRK